jgi:hypothetical protein
MLTTNFNHTLDTWIEEFEQYDFAQLTTKPSPDSWSLGQVGMHLIENTEWFLDQVRICVGANENAMEDPLPEGKTMLGNNRFPDEVLEGPPENLVTPQPESKEQLLHSLREIKTKMNELDRVISTSPFNGKTKHPGLGYFDARQWLQFADMHYATTSDKKRG